MQNNYYYMLSPQMMYPPNMEFNPYPNPQMMAGLSQMAMYNQFQNQPNFNQQNPDTENI